MQLQQPQAAGLKFECRRSVLSVRSPGRAAPRRGTRSVARPWRGSSGGVRGRVAGGRGTPGFNSSVRGSPRLPYRAWATVQCRSPAACKLRHSRPGPPARAASKPWQTVLTGVPGYM
eukprot:747023-Hanusia_phi.AAC.1